MTVVGSLAQVFDAQEARLHNGQRRPSNATCSEGEPRSTVAVMTPTIMSTNDVFDDPF